MKNKIFLLILLIFNIRFASAQLLCVHCFDQNDSISDNVNNLLVNGSFENSTCTGGNVFFCPVSSLYNCNISNWTCTGGGVSTYANVYNTGFAQGNYSVYFGNSFCNVCSTTIGDTNCLSRTSCEVTGIPAGFPYNNASYGGATGLSLEQQVNGLILGNVYVLEFWAGGEDGFPIDGVFGVDVGFGNNILACHSTPTSNYTGTRFIIEFAAIAASHTIKFTNWGHICNACTELIIDDAKLYTLNELSPSIPPCLFSGRQSCLGDSTNFTAGNPAALLGSAWNFGDTASGGNNVSYIFAPSHYYGDTGTYNVQLILYFTTGFVDTVYNTVHVSAIPQFSLGNDTSMCLGDSILLHALAGAQSYLWQDGSTDSTFYANDSGYYYVRVTNYGCSATDTIYITTGACQTPLVSLASSDTLFCGKQCLDFYDLSTNNPSSWLWYFPGADSTSSTLQNPTNICYNSYGSFDVTLIACNASGCDTLHLVNFINEFQTPQVPVVTVSSDTLYSTQAFSYQWYNISGAITGATNQYYVFQQAGSYYVIITDSNGCAASSNVMVLAIGELVTGSSDISIVPDPNDGHFEIIFPAGINEFDYFILYDVTGRMIFNSGPQKINHHFKIDVTEAMNGIYFMKLKSGNRTWNKKMMVNR